VAEEDQWTFVWNSAGSTPGQHLLTVRARDENGQEGSDTLVVHLPLFALELKGARRTVSALMIRRDLVDLDFELQTREALRPVAFRLLRSLNGGTFEPLGTFIAEQMTDGRLNTRDAYLDPQDGATYRMEALDASGLVLGSSEDLAL